MTPFSRTIAWMLPAKTPYVPCLLYPSGEIAFSAGAFVTEDLAQVVIERWKAEGRTEEMAINILSLYDTVEDWESDQ